MEAVWKQQTAAERSSRAGRRSPSDLSNQAAVEPSIYPAYKQEVARPILPIHLSAEEPSQAPWPLLLEAAGFGVAWLC